MHENDTFVLDYIGIGAARAGTTWVAHCLREHPDVCLSSKKELHYFATKALQASLNTEMGEQWYQSHFSHCRIDQKKGELCPSYLFDPLSPQMILDRFPGIKIFGIFRNPVDAVYSHYLYSKSIHPHVDSFELFIKERPDFLEYYRYFPITKLYTELYPSDQLCFLLFDDIERNPKKLLEELYQFLDVDPSFVPTCIHKKINEQNAVRNKLLRNAMSYTKHLLEQTAFTRKFYKSIGLERLGWALMHLNTSAKKAPAMSLATRTKLIEYYKDDMQKLGRLIGKDLSHWIQ